MDIFDSEWLVSMLTKSSATPQGRMLSLFDVLNDWLKAPKISALDAQTQPNIKADQALVSFITTQAKACGAANPAMLAEHIVLIARSAAQQVANHPESNDLIHAKEVANALILAQTQRNWLSAINTPPAKAFIYGIAASTFLIVISVSIWLPELIKETRPAIAQTEPATVTANAMSKNITASDAAKMYTKYEQMRNGTCQFPEALQIPDKDKAIYLENVVGGKLPNNLDDLAVATTYLEKVRCNFTPMLMANSK